MSEKIYCKDCRFCANGACHRRPPFLVSWHKDSLFPAVYDFDWCGMAERREDVKPGGFDINKIEAGDVVYFISNNEIGKMKAENNRLRKLIAEIREFLIGGAIPGKIHLKQEHIRDIYTVASEEDENRRNGK